MNIKKLNIKKVLMLLLSLVLVFNLSACSGKNGEKDEKSAKVSETTAEPKNLDEAVALHKDLMSQENAILSINTELWEKVFIEADKGMVMSEDGKNYGDFLLKTIESSKSKFKADELKLLKEGAEKIRDIESQLTLLEEKFPEVARKSLDSDMSVPADSSMNIARDQAADESQKFPAFEGKDLDGKDVSSDKLFSGNAVTLVNFWFTTCSPCVGELGDLEDLHKELAKKGGAVVGINSFTLDGQEEAIKEAKELLAKKGVSYQNVYFDSDSKAGEFTGKVFAYPTTYVVDREGNIVGDPIVGGINNKAQREKLQALIDEALEADKK